MSDRVWRRLKPVMDEGGLLGAPPPPPPPVSNRPTTDSPRNCRMQCKRRRAREGSEGPSAEIHVDSNSPTSFISESGREIRVRRTNVAPSPEVPGMLIMERVPLPPRELRRDIERTEREAGRRQGGYWLIDPTGMATGWIQRKMPPTTTEITPLSSPLLRLSFLLFRMCCADGGHN